MFTVSCTSDKIWNVTELVGFLASNQNKKIDLNIVPEAICLHNLGLYELLDKFQFHSVTIHTSNPFEQHSHYGIRYKGPNFWFARTASIDPELHNWNLNRIFLCLYHRPTAARLGIASHVYKHCAQHALIHFSATEAVDFELDKLLQWHRPSAAAAAALLPELPLLLGDTGRYTKTLGYDYTDPLTDLYCDILIDLVVESHVSGTTFFPTEKTVRPMLLKKPFVIFGSRDYLVYLRQMGFRTFSDFWDEDYDGFEHCDRLTKIQHLIDHLASLSQTQLEQMYWDMQYTLEHNYNLLINQNYNTSLEKL